MLCCAACSELEKCSWQLLQRQQTLQHLAAAAAATAAAAAAAALAAVVSCFVSAARLLRAIRVGQQLRLLWTQLQQRSAVLSARAVCNTLLL
jgi:hypothetical protein